MTDYYSEQSSLGKRDRNDESPEEKISAAALAAPEICDNKKAALESAIDLKQCHGAVCRAKRQPPTRHYWSRGLWLTRLCLGRQARDSFDFCAVLLKNNTAGLATALGGDRRLCRQASAAAAGRQQAQLDVVRQMPFLQHLQGA